MLGGNQAVSLRVEEGGGVPVLNYLGYVGDSGVDEDPFTLEDANFGVAASNRLIVIAVAASNSHYPASVTIGGVTATLHAGGGSNIDASIWAAVVPTGESGDIVIDSNIGLSYGFTWFSIYTDTPTPIDTDIDTSKPLSVTISTSGGGAVVYVLSTRSDPTVDTPTWSGTSTPVEATEMVFYGRYGASGSMAVDAGDTVVNGDFAVADTSSLVMFTVASWAL